MRAWERENAMYLPIDFYPATLAMGHLALSLSLSPSTSYRISLQRDRRDIDGKRLTSFETLFFRILWAGLHGLHYQTMG